MRPKMVKRSNNNVRNNFIYKEKKERELKWRKKRGGREGGNNY
jgi:hypothetical protein